MTDSTAWAQRSSPAWQAAWGALRERIIADGLGDGSDLMQEHPVFGEGWQYMGSVVSGDCMEHEFRHRCHPSTEARESRVVRTAALSAEGNDTGLGELK